ncbi:MAG: FAD-binding domain-containing protein [Pseudomonadota bacterium]
MSAQVQAVWFKRDLRIHDHRALYLAAQSGPVLPFFVAEPDYWQQPDASGRQWAFVAECLSQLRQDLAEIGLSLRLDVGPVTDTLTLLHRELGLSALWSHEETGNAWTFERDKRVAAWCRLNSVAWRQERQNGVIRGLKKRDGWATRWDRFMAEPVSPPPDGARHDGSLAPAKIPSAADLGMSSDLCPSRQAGGRSEALQTLDSFLTERGVTYRHAMSSPNSAFEACSRLSPHLAWGTVSLREVTQATNKRRVALNTNQAAPKSAWRGALSSFSGRLHWHCHFMQKLESQPSLEHTNLHPAYNGVRGSSADQVRYDAWAKGETGLPFVDACMRALMATGWLNFRMRAMLMAVASYHLWLDWRRPGEHLARQFTDYEPGIHWPQVQMQSGTSGINTVRIYNPVKQGFDQDPKGTFVRKWVPQLAAIPDEFIHEPWRWDGAGHILDKAYPLPIVDHLSAAKQARQKVWAVRASPQYRNVANAIQERHGSRKSGVRFTGRKRKAPKNQDQLALDL